MRRFPNILLIAAVLASSFLVLPACALGGTADEMRSAGGCCAQGCTCAHPADGGCSGSSSDLRSCGGESGGPAPSVAAVVASRPVDPAAHLLVAPGHPSALVIPAAPAAALAAHAGAHAARLEATPPAFALSCILQI
jgi:hypothetical protein